MGAAQNQGTTVDLDLQHPYLRNCKTRTTSNGIDMLATVPSQLTTYKKWKEQLQSFSSSSQHSQYLLLPTHHKFDEGGVCSTSGQLTLAYKCFPRLLSSQIISRKKQGKKFTEGQLWFLLFTQAISKYALSQNGEYIGNIHPRNVFLNESGDIKIACLLSWPGQVSNYRRAILQQQSGYLAPQDIQRLKLGAMDNQINTQSQIFAIGLVLLSTASLQSQQDLYQMRERQFQQDIFFSRLGKFQHDTTYSEIFRAVISNLLQIQPLKRMNLQQLKLFLEKHSENIIAKKPLKIDNVSKKLQKTITEMFRAIKPIENIQKAIINPPPINTQTPINKIFPPVHNIISSNPQILPPFIPRPPSQKILNFINFDEKRPSSQNLLPSPIKVINNQSNHQFRSIEPNKNEIIVQKQSFTSLPNMYNTPPLLPFSPQPEPVINVHQQSEDPHRPTISRGFSSISGITPVIKKTQSIPFQKNLQSFPKYKPFQSIINKSSNQQNSPSKYSIEKQQINLKLQNTIIKQQQQKIGKIIKQSQQQLDKQQKHIIQLKSDDNKLDENVIQRPTITQIWLGEQTSIGQLNLLMQTNRQNFYHSLITTKYQPQIIKLLNQQNEINNNKIIDQTVKQLSQQQQNSSQKIYKENKNIQDIYSHPKQSEIYDENSYKHQQLLKSSVKQHHRNQQYHLEKSSNQLASQKSQKEQKYLQQQKQLTQLNQQKQSKQQEQLRQSKQSKQSKQLSQQKQLKQSKQQKQQHEQNPYNLQHTNKLQPLQQQQKQLQQKISSQMSNKQQQIIQQRQHKQIISKQKKQIQQNVNYQIRQEIKQKISQSIKQQTKQKIKQQIKQQIPISIKQQNNIKQQIKIQIQHHKQQNNQQLSTNNIGNNIFTPTVKLWGLKSNTTSNLKNNNNQTNKVNVCQIQVKKQQENQIQKLHNSIQSHQINLIPVTTTQQNLILEKKQIDQQSNKLNDEELLKKYQHQSSKSLSQNTINKQTIEVPLDHNYILIQQDSKSITQSKDEKQHQVINNKDNQIIINQITQSRLSSVEQQQSQIIQYHTYSDIQTDGTFEECWQEILMFLRDPTDYSTLIDPEKVRIRILQNRWSLKIGPGIFDIFLNKQQGKFLLRNCEQSRCDGQMLGGVFKDEQKIHRIWFNSAYFYRGKKIPSKQLIDDCLKTCKQNIIKRRI